MTLTDEHDLNIPKMYLHTKNKLSASRISKVWTLQNTDRREVWLRTYYNATFADSTVIIVLRFAYIISSSMLAQGCKVM